LPPGVEVSLFFRPNQAVCATNGAIIQFASAETAGRIGLTTQQVIASSEERRIEAPAEVVFDETRSTVITTTVPALVTRWVVSPGDVVKEGDIIAHLRSPHVAELEAELLAAQAELLVHEKERARHEQLKERDLISDSEYEQQVARTQQAVANVTSNRGLLRAAGLSETDINEVIETGAISSEFRLRSPANGLIVERIAQLGELLEAGRAFAMLADPHAMWIEARLTEEQIRRVDLDQTLTFASDGRGLDRVGAKVIWVSQFLDSHTRTGVVRAQVNDPAIALQAGEFGRVEIMSRTANEITLVPKDAVQWEGCCNVVFVKETADRFRPHKVLLGGGSGPYYQVIEGLEPGAEVVVDGAFLLKTELKKSSLGAGCCDVEPAG
jgi:cobalt-zinc-cadmium efflux system membrane fusion protein